MKNNSQAFQWSVYENTIHWTGFKNYVNLQFTYSRDISVGIATHYGLDGPEIESRWGRDFPHLPDLPWGPPSLLYNGYRLFPGGKAAGAWR